jgi:hypothetical protein
MPNNARARLETKRGGLLAGFGIALVPPKGGWPEAVSDGLTLPCSDCGVVPRFDYRVSNEFWRDRVPDNPAHRGVVCLPCLDRRCGGVGLADAIEEIQWTGTGHTVVMVPTLRHVYAAHEPPRCLTRASAGGGERWTATLESL